MDFDWSIWLEYSTANFSQFDLTQKSAGIVKLANMKGKILRHLRKNKGKANSIKDFPKLWIPLGRDEVSEKSASTNYSPRVNSWVLK